jgi:hypothetical protein
LESSGKTLHGYLLIFRWSEEKKRPCGAGCMTIVYLMVHPVGVYWFEKVIKNANEIYVVCTEIKMKIQLRI